MTASRYWARAKYLSPRARWRAFCASGDRAHPIIASRRARSRTIDARVVPGILSSFMNLAVRMRSRLWSRGALAEHKRPVARASQVAKQAVDQKPQREART